MFYLALEDSDRRMQQRCFMVMQQDGVPELFYYLLQVEPGTLLAVIAGQLAEHPDTAVIAIDTFGKVMPPIRNGDTAYQRDYRIGGELHKVAAEHPGLTIIAAHHTRKTASTDFVDMVSGTNGLAGSADTIMVLTRERNSPEGLLRVTGRDIEEAEYAITSDGGRWAIDGADLADSAAAAHERAEAGSLSGKSLDILNFIRKRPQGATAKEVVEEFGSSAYTYLKRLADGEHITKLERGIYKEVA